MRIGKLVTLSNMLLAYAKKPMTGNWTQLFTNQVERHVNSLEHMIFSVK